MAEQHHSPSPPPHPPQHPPPQEFTRLGLNTANLTVTLADNTTYTASRTLFATYVRRSLRSLTDSEREEFFDAFATMITTDRADGVAAYGDSYTSLREFVGAHLTASGRRNSDWYVEWSGVWVGRGLGHSQPPPSACH